MPATSVASATLAPARMTSAQTPTAARRPLAGAAPLARRRISSCLSGSSAPSPSSWSSSSAGVLVSSTPWVAKNSPVSLAQVSLALSESRVYSLTPHIQPIISFNPCRKPHVDIYQFDCFVMFNSAADLFFCCLSGRLLLTLKLLVFRTLTCCLYIWVDCFLICESIQRCGHLSLLSGHWHTK